MKALHLILAATCPNNEAISVDLRFIPRVIEFLGYDVNRHRKMTHHRRPILTHPSGLI